MKRTFSSVIDYNIIYINNHDDDNDGGKICLRIVPWMT